MRPNIIKLIAVFAFVGAFITKSNAQIEVMQNYIFASDSIKGFDESAASAAAFAGNFYGNEYKVFMYKEKRAFIKQKYNLFTPSAQVTTLFQNPVASAVVMPGGACNNEDFELAAGGSNIVAPAAVQGWTLQSGSNPSSCSPPNLSAVNFYTVFTGQVSDTKVGGGQVASYFDASTGTVPSGTCFIRLNNAQAGAKAVRLTKTFIPTASSALFQYAYLTVLQDGCHGCCNQAGFEIKVAVTNTATNATSVLTCPNISVSVPSGTNCGSFGCQFTVAAGGPTFVPSPTLAPGSPTNNGWVYCPWTESAIDLTNYIGSAVTISITVRDCDAGGHAGYTYFDAKCSPMIITGNNNPFPAGSTNVTLPTCGPNGATMCATPGLGPYSWAGPGTAGTSYTAFSMSNACFITSISATYTLYMNPPGSCFPIQRIITTTITPAPQLAITPVQAVCGGTVATITATTSGSASNPAFIYWSPSPQTINTTSTQVSYTIPTGSSPMIVTVTASDPLGCLISATAPINPAAPAPSVNIVNLTGTYMLTCVTPSIDLDVTTTYTYGTLNYLWQSASFTYSNSLININTTFTAPYTVTLTATDPVTMCFDKKVITITTNTTLPTANITPLTQSINCTSAPTASTVTLTAISPTVNVTHTIYDPFGGSYSVVAQQALYVPGPGTYTHHLLDMINGCVKITPFTVSASTAFPTFELSSSPAGYTLGCTTKSVITISINNGQVGQGGAVSYTLLFPGSTGIVPTTGTLGAISSFTNVNIPGTYTVITRANNGFCDTKIPISVTTNTLGPSIDSLIIPRNILDCYVPRTRLKAYSKNPDAFYTWKFSGTPGTLSSDTLGVLVESGAPTNTLIETYTLVITDDNNKCITTTLVPIYQNLFKPKAAITGAIPLTCFTPTLQLSNNSSSTIPPNSIFATGSGVGGMLWQGPTPMEPLSNSSSYIGSVPGIYTLTAKDLDNGCTSTTTTTVPDKQIFPIFTLPTATVECGSSVKVKPTVTSSSASLLYTWTGPVAPWDQDPQTGVLTTSTVGEYKLVAFDKDNGCASEVLTEIVNGKLIAEVTVDNVAGYAPLTVNITNNSRTVTNDTSKIVSVWNFGNGTSSTVTSRSSRTVVYNQPGTYSITLYVSKGTCIEKIQKVITVEIPSSLTIPNVFTPNGDGVNDFYFLKTTNLSEISASIYDRWGHLVYELLNSDKSNILWDGKNMAGKDVAEGTYFYIIKAKGKDAQPYESKGTISLFR
jgi:gliding motility-associated-like protein